MSAAQALPESLKFTIDVVNGPHAGMREDFEKGSITIGRGPENDIALVNDPRVSRQHIEIKQSMGQFYVVNLSQKNFVLMNGESITSEKLANQSVIQLGESEIRLTIMGGTELMEPVSAEPAPPVVPPPMPKVSPKVNSAAPTLAPSQPAAAGWNPVPARAAPPAHAGGRPPSPYQGGPPMMTGTWANPGGPGASSSTSSAAPAASGGGMNKLLLLLVVGAIAVGLFMMQGKKGQQQRKIEDRPFRSTEEISRTRDDAENDIKKFQERRDRMNQQIYQKAYENFLRGYRDYRQGQFLRAKEAFQLVLNLDPENELAKRYWHLAQEKNNQLIEFNILQGKRYLEKQNYRLCRASFQTAMTMLTNEQSSARYSEAKTLHRQCSAAAEGRY